MAEMGGLCGIGVSSGARLFCSMLRRTTSKGPKFKPYQLLLGDRLPFDLPCWSRTTAFPCETSLSAGGWLSPAWLSPAVVFRKSV